MLRCNVVFVFIALLLCLSGFILPASAIEPVPSESTAMPAELSWIDTADGSVLFTILDIKRFDWEKQIIELSPESATHLLGLSIPLRKDYAVQDANGVIYRGRLVRPLDSEGFDGAAIILDPGPLFQLPAAPFFSIRGGYPTPGGSHDLDRFNERLHKALIKAGVVKSIPEAELPVKKLWSGFSWVGGEQVIKASAILFPDTFRIGQDACLHILLQKGAKPDFVFDKLVVIATAIANDGKFISSQEIMTITPPLLDSGIYIGRYRPWETSLAPLMPVVTSSTLPRYPKDALNEGRGGTTVISVTVESDGSFSALPIVASSGSKDLDDSALRAAQQFTFSPVMIEGKPGKGMMKLQFTFANNKVEQIALPGDPMKIAANPGPAKLYLKIKAFKKDGETFFEINSWLLPMVKINLQEEVKPIPPFIPPPAVGTK